MSTFPPIPVDTTPPTPFPLVLPLNFGWIGAAGGNSPNSGPYIYGSAIYTAAIINSSSSQIGIYKSTNNGATWSIQDSGNGPLSSQTFAMRMFGSNLYVMTWLPSNAGLVVYPFSMVSNTWTASTPSAPVSINRTVPLLSGFDFFVTSSEIIAIYNTVDSVTHNPNGMVMAQYSGGSWGSPTAFGTEFSPAGLSGTVLDDATDTLHVFYAPLGTPSPNPLNHVSISSTGVISAYDTVISNYPLVIGTVQPVISRGCVSVGVIFAPYIHLSTSTAGVPALISGSPGSWVVQNLDATNTVLGPYYDQICAFLFGSVVYIIWGLLNGSNTQVLQTTTRDGVTFSPITVLWDAQVDPAVDAPYSSISRLSCLSADILPNSALGVLLTIWGATNWLHFFSPGTTLTLTASCNTPPPAYVGVFYTHDLMATGGTPPYTWSLISGSLPPGLMLNPDGTISGTPSALRSSTAKTFTFTVQVTDSNGLTATVTCSISIFNYLAGFPCN
jgi:hypothetical protein